MEKNRLKEIFKFNKQVVIGRHGVYNLFDQNRINTPTAKKHLKIDPNDFIILFFGILRENKGMEELINAIKLLKTKNSLKNIKLLIYTTLRDHFELKDYYLSLIRQYKLEKDIIANIRIKQTMSLKEIETIFKASDVVVLPYTHISQSGILNLAIGFHKPVIISDAFLEKEEIANKLGLVVPKKNSKMLAEAILEMKIDYNNYLNLFNSHIKEYETAHNWEKLAKLMLKISNNLNG